MCKKECYMICLLDLSDNPSPQTKGTRPRWWSSIDLAVFLRLFLSMLI